jgi:hypothetical protein
MRTFPNISFGIFDVFRLLKCFSPSFIHASRRKQLGYTLGITLDTQLSHLQRKFITANTVQQVPANIFGKTI